jgi:hypothetical protein
MQEAHLASERGRPERRMLQRPGAQPAEPQLVPPGVHATAVSSSHPRKDNAPVLSRLEEHQGLPLASSLRSRSTKASVRPSGESRARRIGA